MRPHLDWDGCWNVRDLGGLPLADGGRTTGGAVVRGDHPRKLGPSGWQQLWEHGVRTVLELRTEGADEDEPDRSPRPEGLRTVRVAIEDGRDRDFVARNVESGLWGTPLYYRDALVRWPDRAVAAVRVVANAAPGGVLVHCGVGRDRTGLVAMVLLALAGVTPDAIAADYVATYERMRAAGDREELAQIEALLAQHGTTAEASIRGLLGEVDVVSCLREGGLEEEALAAVRARLAAAS